MEFLYGIFNIQKGTDREKTIEEISKGVVLKGYNIWILICSAFLASIGLNTNSSAVIIGAMLISPLMTPILGVGLSIAIYDKELLFRSIRNLSIAVVVGLAVSVLFFILTPLREATPEINARTYPTLLDVLVAVFGGVAGIVSASRSEKTNAIPGVAIATALMPPLCTAGYGIATYQWSYFLGAIYLFFINAIFISLATFLISKYLHFHTKKFVDKKTDRIYSRTFAALAFVVILPSIYFLYTVYKKEAAKKQLQVLVLDKIEAEGSEILKWEIYPTDSAKLVKVYQSGNPISPDEIASIDSSLQKAGLKDYRLKIFRVNLTKDEISNLTEEAAKLAINEMQLQAMRETPLQNLSDSLKLYNTLAGPEMKIAFPYLDTIQSGIIMSLTATNIKDTMPVFFYKSKNSLTIIQKKHLYQYLLYRTNKDTVLLLPLQ